jgi:hypothetical protein
MEVNTTKQKKEILFVFTLVFFLLVNAVSIAQTGVGINTTNPRSDFEVNGSFAKKVTAVTTSTTLDATHSIVVSNNAATAIPLTLPAISGCIGRIYTIKKGTSSADITIDANAAETIEGVLTVVLSDVKVAVTLFNDGMEWKEVGHHVAPFPMGEISYFNSSTGTPINISNQSDGSSNMKVCRPATTLLNRGEFDNGGSNNGTLRYVGKNTKTFHIACTISGTLVSGTNKTLVFGIGKNGTVQSNSKVLNRFSSANDLQSTSLHVMLTLVPNDYLEFFVGNTTDSADFSFRTFNLVAIGMPD